MIAMQYSFTLPADYDMGIVEERIRDKGPMLDGFPHLRFKAYLSARKQDGDFASTANLYAPFYLWDHPDGLTNFLSSPGFAGLTQAFGWPTVKTWFVWDAALAEDLSQTRFASREIEPIAPYSDLASHRSTAFERTRAAQADGALASLSAFDPTNWTSVHFRLWPTVPTAASENTQIYSVGHVSLP